jgi:hypothetical protein
MRAMRRTLVLAVLVLVACASSSNQGPPPNHGTAVGSNMICREERPTGSSIPRTVCRTPEEIDQDHQDAQDLARTRPAVVSPVDL